VAELTKTMNADKVGRNLWIGAVPTNPATVDKHFDALVLTAREFQDVFPVHKYPGTELILAPLDDDRPTAVDRVTALKAALDVYDLNKKGKKVLVTCAKGVNRSALIAGLAMVLGGDSAAQAIAKIRAARKPPSGATPLFNQHFCQFIKDVDKAVSPQSSG
jgi:protein-tyrosine phosphatase